jgi:hypothetical protein
MNYLLLLQTQPNSPSIFLGRDQSIDFYFRALEAAPGICAALLIGFYIWSVSRARKDKSYKFQAVIGTLWLMLTGITYLMIWGSHGCRGVSANMLIGLFVFIYSFFILFELYAKNSTESTTFDLVFRFIGVGLLVQSPLYITILKSVAVMSTDGLKEHMWDLTATFIVTSAVIMMLVVHMKSQTALFQTSFQSNNPSPEVKG